MKRILVLAAAATGAIVVGQRVKAQRAEADLWAQLTDDAPAPSSAPAGRDAAESPSTAH